MCLFTAASGTDARNAVMAAANRSRIALTGCQKSGETEGATDSMFSHYGPLDGKCSSSGNARLHVRAECAIFCEESCPHLSVQQRNESAFICVHLGAKALSSAPQGSGLCRSSCDHRLRQLFPTDRLCSSNAGRSGRVSNRGIRGLRFARRKSRLAMVAWRVHISRRFQPHAMF